MRILHFIGNGFDRNLGLRTSYSHFYDYYKTIDSPNRNVEKLKEEILRDPKLEFWSDLEFALGKYAKNFSSLQELDDIILDLKKELANYLDEQEKDLNSVKFNENQLNDYLSFPERTLLLTDKEKLEEFKQKWSSHHWIVDIVTLNYTKTLEKMFAKEVKNIQIGWHNNNATIKLSEIIHIHGFIDKEMVLGVNDSSQIDNSNFHNDQDALETIVKPDCNLANKNGVDRKLTGKIRNANLICIFGSSLGETDMKWWQEIGERLKSDCNLIIFKRGEDIDLQNLNLIGRQERATRTRFLSLTKLNEREKQLVGEKIYVGINTNIFSKLISEKQ